MKRYRLISDLEFLGLIKGKIYDADYIIPKSKNKNTVEISAYLSPELWEEVTDIDDKISHSIHNLGLTNRVKSYFTRLRSVETIINH